MQFLYVLLRVLAVYFSSGKVLTVAAGIIHRDLLISCVSTCRLCKNAKHGGRVRV